MPIPRTQIPDFNPPAPPPYSAPNSAGGFNYKPLSGTDQGAQTANNRDIFYGRGEQINANLQNRSAQQGGIAEGYRGNADQLAAWMAQNPGYTQDEAAQIMQQQGLDNLGNVNYDSNFLTGDEQSGITSNPYSQLGALDQGAVYGAYDNGAAGSRAAQQGTAGALQANVGQTSAALNSAIDPSQLGMSGQYQNNQDAVLNKTAGDVYGGINYGKLSTSGDYNKNMNFGAGDTQNLATQAGIGVGQRFAATQDADERALAASGNSNPLAAAAMRNRNMVNSAASGSDAELAAQIQGKQLELGTTQQKEATRLGAEQTYAGMESGAAQNLGNMAASAVQNRENTRLGAQQDISGRQMQAATTTGQMGQNAAEFSGQQQLSNEQLQQERNIATQQQEQQVGMNALQYGEAQAAARAGTVATNRQGVNQSNQTNQFNRGFQVNDATANRAANVANQRVTGTNNVLGYYTGQQGQANSNVNTANQQGIANYGAQSGAVSNATGQGIENKGVNQAGSFVGAIKTGAGRAISGAITQGAKSAFGG